MVSGVGLRPLTWWLLSCHLGTALIVTWLWDPFRGVVRITRVARIR